MNDVVLRDEEGAVSLDLNVFDSLSRGLESKGRKSPDTIGKTSVCSSKSCRVRTVDNIASFWSNARGGSFRSKVSVGRKKSIKDSRESLGPDRVLSAAASGTSTVAIRFFAFRYLADLKLSGTRGVGTLTLPVVIEDCNEND